MSFEIERKFLVDKLPDSLEDYSSSSISQGYILIADDFELRLRKKGDLYFQTIKSGGDLERNEYEIELSEKQFSILWPLTIGKRIEKTRYEIEYLNYSIELDIYNKSLEGLSIAEVEFKSVDDSNKFVVPDWFGDEVTSNKLFKNKYLAIHGIPEK